ncbi:MAG: winged helix-turn-helix domain-containing protein [Acidobacteria bacterium]|nr:winged helix-turn-helix domain-containing protein [Acidobacteriota bacterium]
MVVQIRTIYSLGEFRLDPHKKLITCEGATVHLANRPFQVLLHLIENRDRMVSRAELLDLFWDGKDVYENTLTKCVGAIRKALNDTLEQPRFIETQWAKGYRFIGALEESHSKAHQSSSFEIERTRGVKVIVEEEYLEILPDGETTTQSQLPDEKPLATNLLDEKTISANSAIKSAQALLSRRAVALAVAITAILLLSVGWLALRSRSNLAEARSNAFNATSSLMPSIAVLPFRNLSDDAASEYFSDGLTETFITELAKIDGLKVISRNSVFTFKGKDVDPLEVGRKFDVAAILEGSVRKSGDMVRVDVRLVNTKDGSVIWSGNTYDRALKDILAVQDEIACSVAAGLRVKLCGEAETAKHYTSNVDAYQAYLKGRYYWNKRTAEGIKRSIEHFEQAISIDPNYALAYAGLADSYIQGVWHVPFDPKEVLPKAKAAALQAVKIDDTLAEAHTALGNIYQMEWQWSKAGKEFARALELNPSLARAYHVQAFHLDIIGQHNEAVRAIRQAQALDPLSMIINVDVAVILWDAGQHDEALAQCLKAVEMEPNFATGHWTLALFYQLQGREKETAEAYFKTLMLNGRSETDIAAYRKAYMKKGISGIYQKELAEQLRNQASGGYSSPIQLARLYASLGQKEAAFKWLEFAVADRNAEGATIKHALYFDSLRSDPRYVELLRRMGFSE